MAPRADQWSKEESAIALFFISRAITYKVAIDVIYKKYKITRTISQCSARVRQIRIDMTKDGLPDPLHAGTMSYDIGVVDEWLGRQMDKGKLQELLEIDDDVEEILCKHV